MKRFKAILCSLLILGQVLWGLDLSSIQVYAQERAQVKEFQQQKEKTELIIKFKDEADKTKKLDAAKKKLGLKEMKEVKDLGSHTMVQIGAQDDPAAVIAELEKDAAVEYVQPNYRLYAASEPRYEEQWALENFSNTHINAPAAWAVTKGDPGVLVGVLDTGIDINHEDLKGNIYVNAGEIAGNGVDDDGNGYIDDVSGWDFYNKEATVFDGIAYDTHGTHVAGIIAAEENGKGISGVAPKVKLLPLKFIHDGAGYTSDAIEAIAYAQKLGVKVMNCSFGGPDNNKALRDAMADADILFITAAGNGGLNIDQSPIYPAAFELDNVIAVTAINNAGAVPAYANYGTRVELAAPGDSILSTIPDNGYSLMSGTSMAAPFVAGVAALIKSKYPGMTNREVANRIKTTGTKLATLNGKTLAGTTLEANNALAGEITAAPAPAATPAADAPVTTGNSKIKPFAATIPAYLQEAIHFGQNGVNPAVGNFSTSETDMSYTAPGFTLNIKRTYNSKNTDTGLLGKGWTFGFESTLKADTTNAALFTAKLPDGSAQVFELSGSTYTAYDSHSTLVKNGGDHLLTTSDQYQYHFNTTGRLDWMADRDGNRISISLDSAGKILSITDAAGRTVNLGYNSDGRITSISDPMGRTVKYEYSGVLLSKVTDPNGSIRNYTYTSELLSAIKNKKNDASEETITYSGGKVATYKDKNGKVLTYAYDTANRVTTMTDGNSKVTKKYYDAQNYVTKTIDPENLTTLVTYVTDSSGVNRYGEEASITDRNGAVTVYTRDAKGNITQIVNPDGGTSKYEYDTKNNLIKETDEDGFAKWYVYDSAKLKLLKEVTAMYGAAYTGKDDAGQFAIKRYTYGAVGSIKGLLIKTVDADGNAETYEYDKLGNRTRIIDGLGNAHTYTYNIIGWITSHTTPRGFVTAYTYDKNGNITQEKKPEGTIARVFSPDGYLLSETNPNGGTTTYLRNTAGLPTQMTPPVGSASAVTYTYDIYGNCTRETRPNGSSIVRGFDGINRMISESFDEGSAPVKQMDIAYAATTEKQTFITQTRYLPGDKLAVTQTTNDFRGNPVKIVNPDGGTKTVTYNLNGSVKSQTDFTGKTDTYTYTFGGNIAAKWESAGSAMRYSAYEYTAAGRVRRELHGRDPVGLWVVPSEDRMAAQTHTYDGAGNRIQTTDKEKRTTQFAYDAEGNCTYKLIHTGTATLQEESFAYNSRGQITEQSNSVLGKDLQEQGLAPDGKVVLTTRNGYDKNGNLVSITRPDGSTIETVYDLMNRPVSVTTANLDEDGNLAQLVTAKTYDTMGNLASETDPNGNVTTYTYTKRGKVERTVKTLTGDTPQTLTTFSVYDTAGRMTAQVLPRHYVEGSALSAMTHTEYTYDGMDRVITAKEVDVQGGVEFVSKAYAYDGNGRVTKELDGEGYKAGAGYNEEESIRKGYGVTTAYNGFGDITSRTDARGYTTRYEYDGMGRKTSVIYPDGSIATYAYNDRGDIVREGRRANHSDTEKVIATHTYDLAGNRLQTVDGNGNKTTFSYNGLGKVSRMTASGDSSIEAYTQTIAYDRNGRQVMVSDSVGKISTTEYDKLDRVIGTAVTGPSGKTSAKSRFDKAGNLRYQIDGNGNVTEYQYDSLNRKIRVLKTTKSADNTVTAHETQYAYDGNGNTVEEKTLKTKGGVTFTATVTSTYDGLNRVLTVTDGEGAVAKTLAYDRAHRQISSIDALGNETRYEYDRSGNLTKTLQPGETGAPAITETKLYDGLGRIFSAVDGAGGANTYKYDPISGKIRSVTNGMGEETLCAYDVMGNLVSQTDPNGNTQLFEYNSRNLLLRRIDAGGRTGEAGSYTYLPAKTESYTYYADGSLKETKDRNGVVITTAWDIFGNQTQKAAADLKIGNTYDAVGNKTAMSDITGKTTRVYDELNRVIIKAVPKVGTNAYIYDVPMALTVNGVATTGLAEITKDAKGKETTKVFDRAGRLTEVIDGDGQKTVYEYYPNGSQKSLTYPGGAKEEYTYYANGKLKTLTNTVGGQVETYSSEYDAAGRVIKKTEPRGITTYAYDRAGRMTTVTEPNAKSGSGSRKIEYTYDKAGNRLRQVTSDGSSIRSLMYEYNEQNRLMRTIEQEIAGKTATTEYFYDNNGNQLYHKKEEIAKITDPLNPPTPKFSAFVLGQTTVEQNPLVAWVGSNKYNAFNELVSTKGAGGSIESRYNGEGYRTVKTANGQTTYGLYEGDKLVLETDSSGKEKVRTVYGLNAISRTDNGDKAFYLYNPHADVVNLVSGNSIVATYAYDAFGVPVSGEEWSGVNDSKNAGIRFGGYQYDPESGYYYLNARMYDPTTARFLQEDSVRGTLEDPLSLNLYTYCQNDPVNYWDPSGHVPASVQAKLDTCNNGIKNATSESVKQFYESVKRTVEQAYANSVQDAVNRLNGKEPNYSNGPRTLSDLPSNYNFGGGSNQSSSKNSDSFSRDSDIAKVVEYINDENSWFYEVDFTLNPDNPYYAQGGNGSQLSKDPNFKIGSFGVTKSQFRGYFFIQVPGKQIPVVREELEKEIKKWEEETKEQLRLLQKLYLEAGMALTGEEIAAAAGKAFSNSKLAKWFSSHTDDAFKKARAVIQSDAIEGGLKPGTLSNVDARKWYLESEAKIPSMIDKNLSLEQQAKQAFDLRNQFRTEARELMSDRELAESLYKSDPNLTWAQVVEKQANKGLSGDDIYKAIIESSQRSRTSVNESLGLK